LGLVTHTFCPITLNIKDDDFGHRLFCVLLVIYALRVVSHTIYY